MIRYVLLNVSAAIAIVAAACFALNAFAWCDPWSCIPTSRTWGTDPDGGIVLVQSTECRRTGCTEPDAGTARKDGGR
jgi:hypothetical protein